VKGVAIKVKPSRRGSGHTKGSCEPAGLPHKKGGLDRVLSGKEVKDVSSLQLANSRMIGAELVYRAWRHNHFLGRLCHTSRIHTRLGQEWVWGPRW
jgi:hypothetical protein